MMRVWRAWLLSDVDGRKRRLLPRTMRNLVLTDAFKGPPRKSKAMGHTFWDEDVLL